MSVKGYLKSGVSVDGHSCYGNLQVISTEDGDIGMIDGKYALLVKIAIENHDNLTEENAKLRELLERLVNPDNCKKDIVHIIGNAESLLTELKEQGNE